MKKILLLTFSIIISMFGNVSAAEIIQASGSYIMDSRLDETPATATERARVEAKRNAVEQAGVFVESYTKVVNLEVNEDEVRTIAANLIKIQDEKTSISVIQDNLLKFTVEITAIVDDANPEEFQAMMADRKNLEESVRQKKKLQEEYDLLNQQMEELKTKYESATSEQQIQLKIESARNIAQFNALLEMMHGNDSYSHRDYGLALEFYNRAIQTDSNSAEAYNNRGLTRYHLSQLTDALSDFSRAIDLDKNFSHAYNNRGMILNSMGQYSQAIQDFDKALQLNPTFAFALNNRGNAYAAINQFQNAEQDLTAALRLIDNSAEIHNNLGNVYQSEEKYSEAIDEYSKAIQLNPNYSEAFYNRAIVYYIQNRKSDALIDLKRAIELNPQDSDARDLYDKISNVR